MPYWCHSHDRQSNAVPIHWFMSKETLLRLFFLTFLLPLQPLLLAFRFLRFCNSKCNFLYLFVIETVYLSSMSHLNFFAVIFYCQSNILHPSILTKELVAVEMLFSITITNITTIKTSRRPKTFILPICCLLLSLFHFY